MIVVPAPPREAGVVVSVPVLVTVTVTVTVVVLQAQAAGVLQRRYHAAPQKTRSEPRSLVWPTIQLHARCRRSLHG